jgi:hypothetical protein
MAPGTPRGSPTCSQAATTHHVHLIPLLQQVQRCLRGVQGGRTESCVRCRGVARCIGEGAGGMCVAGLGGGAIRQNQQE